MTEPGDLERAIAAIREAEPSLTVLTGAGVSTESGVPDFRSPGSPWLVHAPIGFAAFMADPAARAEAWRRKFAMDDLWRGARPGRSHLALARMAAAGRLGAVITQNIDGLHQTAGLSSDRLIELHGNGTYAHCLSCGTRFDLAEIRSRFEATGDPPTCACGGLVKSATVSFGEGIRPAVIEAATAATRACRAFLVVGSSLLVRPAATLPLVAQQNGAELIIVNREPTALDAYADHAIRSDAGEFFAMLEAA